MTAPMTRWEPIREINREVGNLSRAIDRLFDESFYRPYRLWRDGSHGELPIDIYQTPNEVVVKAALPGIKPEEVDISIVGDTLTIKGEHKEEYKVKDEDYFLRELSYGSFSRTLTLPVSVNSERSEAVFENGVLTLTMPKAEEVKPKQIKIRPARTMVEARR